MPSPPRRLLSLASLSAGQRGYVIHRDASDNVRSYIDQRGLRPGAAFSVLTTSRDRMLVQVGERRISLARTLAEMVQVEAEEMPRRAQIQEVIP